MQGVRSSVAALGPTVGRPLRSQRDAYNRALRESLRGFRPMRFASPAVTGGARSEPPVTIALSPATRSLYLYTAVPVWPRCARPCTVRRARASAPGFDVVRLKKRDLPACQAAKGSGKHYAKQEVTPRSGSTTSVASPTRSNPASVVRAPPAARVRHTPHNAGRTSVT